jgi:hypothetical protein
LKQFGGFDESPKFKPSFSSFRKFHLIDFFLGVGQFTIVDGEKVTGEDVGNNFFLEKG